MRRASPLTAPGLRRARSGVHPSRAACTIVLLVPCIAIACERAPSTPPGTSTVAGERPRVEPPASASEPATPVVEPAPAPAAWFAGRMRPLAPWVADLRKRVDPA